MVVFLLNSRIYYMHYAPHPGPPWKICFLKNQYSKSFYKVFNKSNESFDFFWFYIKELSIKPHSCLSVNNIDLQNQQKYKLFSKLMILCNRWYVHNKDNLKTPFTTSKAQRKYSYRNKYFTKIYVRITPSPSKLITKIFLFVSLKIDNFQKWIPYKRLATLDSRDKEVNCQNLALFQRKTVLIFLSVAGIKSNLDFFIICSYSCALD